MGLSLSNPSTAVTPNRLITKSGSAGATSLNGQTVASVTAGASGTFGSWVQVTSSTASDGLLTGVWVFSVSASASADVPLVLQIGTGAGGSETTVHEVAFSVNAANTAAFMPITIPVRVAASTRVAARIYSGSSANAYKVLIFSVPHANTEGN